MKKSGKIHCRCSWLVLLLLLPGCFFMSGSIFPQPKELTQVVVGGEGRDKVLILDISGLIRSEGARGLLKSEAGTVEWVRANLDKARGDKRIKALVLRINSPGGFVTPCDIVHAELQRFQEEEKIPVVAVLMNTAASGGYYVATAADRVIAHPTTTTGSIGVIYHGISFTGLLDKVGVEEKTIKTGERKDMGSVFREMSEEERKLIQGIINSHFERFLTVIREGRKGISEENLKDVSDGRVVTAAEALRLGLVDKIGYLEDALEEARKLAGIEEAKVIIYKGSAEALKTIYTGGEGAAAEGEEGFMYY